MDECIIIEEELVGVMKPRAAAAEVKELMRTLKSKKKRPMPQEVNCQYILLKILVWNVRGFNHPLKQKEVVGRIRRLNANLVCLLKLG